MKSVVFVGTGFADISGKEIADFHHGLWKVDCPKMVLRSRSSAKPAMISGAGTIIQSLDHRLDFRLFASRSRNVAPWGMYQSLVSGEVIPDQAYYDLSAIDVGGRVWTAERILPDFNWPVSGQPVVDGYTDELVTSADLRETDSPGRSHLTMHIFSRAKIPRNALTRGRTSIAGKVRSRSSALDAWKFKSCGLNFLIIKPEQEVITIEISSTSAELPDYLEQRVVECLQFMLSRPIHWAILDKWEGKTRTIVLSSQQVSDRTKRSFPILPETMSNPRTRKASAIHHRRLFDCYLRHVLPQSKKRHPLWGQINAVQEAGQGTFIDAQALALTVAVESLLGSEFANLAKPTKAQQEAVKQVMKHVEDWKGSAEIKNRARGSISQLLQSRAGDKMRELVRLGVITEEQRLAWQTLRNASAHTYQSSEITPDKLRGLLMKVQILFWRIIFRAIGYRGPYVDISSPGWPLTNYP